ncbi:MAG TPA: S-layer homology domain-containing protein [Thermoanaerobaculia bacterium]|nr:S-layer homology domain-containing protein [Thermoanaerobaculia bacterium]
MALTCLSGVESLRAQHLVDTATVGTNPVAIAVNPVTGITYVANSGASTVTALGPSGTATIAVGGGPLALAVNPDTNKIYVASNDTTVTVIDGATNSTQSVALGAYPVAMAINPATNRLYLLVDYLFPGESLIVLDGADNTTTLIDGVEGGALAVDERANRIYIGGPTLTAFNGATNEIAAGFVPHGNIASLAVDPSTGIVYAGWTQGVENLYGVDVIETGAPSITPVNLSIPPLELVADSATHAVYAGGGYCGDTCAGGLVAIDASQSVTTYPGVTGPVALALDAVSKRLYVSDSVPSICLGSCTPRFSFKGVDLSTGTVQNVGGPGGGGIAVDPQRGKVYLANGYPMLTSPPDTVQVWDTETDDWTLTAGGSAPQAVAVNAATHRAYVANASTVSVVDMTTGAIVDTVNVCSQPSAIDLNAITNKIYVACKSPATALTVIDGSTDKVLTTLSQGGTAVAVNPVTNRVYVGNQPFLPVLSVIDGSNDTLLDQVAAAGTGGLAVDTVRNKVFGIGGAGLFILNGADDTFTTVPLGNHLSAVAVDSGSGFVYVADHLANTVGVYNASTNSLVTTVGVGSGPIALRVDPVAKDVYVLDQGGNDVTIIGEGGFFLTQAITFDAEASALAVDSANHLAYVATKGGIVAIDGVNLTSWSDDTALFAGFVFAAGAADPTTGAIQFVGGSNSLVNLTERSRNTIPIATSILPLTGNQTIDRTPTFSITATSQYSPDATSVRNVYYQVDTVQGTFLRATASGGNLWSATTATLSYGIHVLYAFATDGQEQADDSPGPSASPIPGSIVSYLFLVRPCETLRFTQQPSPVEICAGSAATFRAAASGEGAVGYQWRKGGVPLSDGGAISGSKTATLTISPVSGGDAGSYDVVATDACPQNQTSSAAALTVDPVPAAPSVSNNGPIAVGQTLQLSASVVAGATYAWTGPNGFASSARQPSIVSASLSAAGVYSVMVTVGGCMSAPATTTAVVTSATPTPSPTPVLAATSTPTRTPSPTLTPTAARTPPSPTPTPSRTPTPPAGATPTPTPTPTGTPTRTHTPTPMPSPTPTTGGPTPTPAITPEFVVPVSLVVDPLAESTADGDFVLEPGETALVEPSWKNVSGSPVSMENTASAFTGPAGSTYAIAHGVADYGSMSAGAIASCAAQGNCYSLSVEAVQPRPATHWDTTFLETPSTGDGAKTWTLHIGDSFSDVPRSQPFYRKIETLLHSGITSGCAATTFCPDEDVTRGEMAIFIAKGMAGGGGGIPVSGAWNGHPYNCAPDGVSLFSDVTTKDLFCKHVHYLAVQNVTLGCTSDRFCPGDAIDREAMAGFIAKALVAPAGGGAVPATYTDASTRLSYSCDPASPNLHFSDVLAADSFCKHVHYLWARGIISGCGGTQYCPGDPVTRDQMAKFLVNAFELLLYGP